MCGPLEASSPRKITRNCNLLSPKQRKRIKMPVSREELERRKALQIPQLKDLHTKVLMRLMNEMRSYQYDKIDPRFASKDWVICGDENHKDGYTFDQIKAELDTREHIPNKKEAKKLRREKLRKGI